MKPRKVDVRRWDHGFGAGLLGLPAVLTSSWPVRAAFLIMAMGFVRLAFTGVTVNAESILIRGLARSRPIAADSVVAVSVERGPPTSVGARMAPAVERLRVLLSSGEVVTAVAWPYHLSPRRGRRVEVGLQRLGYVIRPRL